jgi:hypothetical protein
MNKKNIIASAFVLIAIALVIGSIFILTHRKQEEFGRAFNGMNEAYKKVLFATGQNQTDSLSLMSDYQDAWDNFYSNYKSDPISPYSSDVMWSSSMDGINVVVISSNSLVTKNMLRDAHLELEKVRQNWQEIFLRNKVTMLGFYLTEYHDLMEKAIEEANQDDFDALKTTCASMKAAWQNVKETNVDFKDADLADYNSKLNANSLNLEALCSTSEPTDIQRIKDAASKLKGLFVPLYLKFG